MRPVAHLKLRRAQSDHLGIESLELRNLCCGFSSTTPLIVSDDPPTPLLPDKTALALETPGDASEVIHDVDPPNNEDRAKADQLQPANVDENGTRRDPERTGEKVLPDGEDRCTGPRKDCKCVSHVPDCNLAWDGLDEEALPPLYGISEEEIDATDLDDADPIGSGMVAPTRESGNAPIPFPRLATAYAWTTRVEVASRSVSVERSEATSFVQETPRHVGAMETPGSGADVTDVPAAPPAQEPTVPTIEPLESRWPPFHLGAPLGHFGDSPLDAHGREISVFSNDSDAKNPERPQVALEESPWSFWIGVATLVTLAYETTRRDMTLLAAGQEQEPI